MNISITHIRKATSEEWDKIWNNCDYSTYFHSREWSEIWNAYSQGKMKPYPKLFIFSDDRRALLPLSYTKSLKGIIKNYISSPAGTFGGWISDNDLSLNHAHLLNDQITNKTGNIMCRVNPYNNDMVTVVKGQGKEDDTQTIMLREGFEKIFKRWTKGHASAARKARRDGVKIFLSKNIEDWHSYYQIYEDSLKRWGNNVTCRYSWGLFKIMSERNSPNIRLWLAEYDSQIVAGVLCLYAKQHVVYWHGAALSEYFKLRSVNLLIYDAIKHSCEDGYLWFDFNPSGGLEGVRNFKKSFGAEPLFCNILEYEGRAKKLIKKILQ